MGPEIVSEDEWIAARKALLNTEKELTRARDTLNEQRRRLPAVRIDKDYRFEGPAGSVGLADLFEGRTQLIIYHFMFAPEWDKGCRRCTGWVDQVSAAIPPLLASRNTSFALVSRARSEKLETYKAERHWPFAWYSTNDGDFTYDFGTTLDRERGSVTYNFRSREDHEAAGTGYYFEGEEPLDLQGLSCFLRTPDGILHTYSTFARGVESVGGASYFLDLTALGRQEG